MAVISPTRPPEPAPQPVALPLGARQGRRGRVVSVLGSVAAVLWLAAAVTGSPALAVAGAVPAALLGLYGAALFGVRRRTIARDLDVAGLAGWSDGELDAWLAPAAGDGPLDSTDPASPVVVAPPRLLDRWGVTQMLWAGVAGCLYNAVGRLVERLGAGSSFPSLRGRLVAVLTPLLTALNRQSVRRTVAISALATATALPSCRRQRPPPPWPPTPSNPATPSSAWPSGSAPPWRHWRRRTPLPTPTSSTPARC